MANRTQNKDLSFVNAGTALPVAGDPYGKNTTGATGSSASFRQRGDATQKRVNNDTRVRSDANSGTAGAQGAQVGAASMTDALGGQGPGVQMPPPAVQTQSWQATRQPVDLDSVRQRVLQSLKTPQG